MPVQVKGERREHLCAFVRAHKTEAVLIVVPRLIATLLGGEPAIPDTNTWGDTRLVLPKSVAGRQMKNILTNEEVDAKQDISPGQILNTWPIALFALK